MRMVFHQDPANTPERVSLLFRLVAEWKDQHNGGQVYSEKGLVSVAGPESAAGATS